jgi:arylsulfatase A-like enzyme
MKIGTAAGMGTLVGASSSAQRAQRKVPAGERPRNVLLVIADDLNRFDIAPFVPTPNLERMARYGADFSRAYVPGPLCSLARYGLMLGEYPRRGGLGRIIASVHPPPQVNPGPIVDHRKWTFPRAFASGGYRTALFGKWHLGFPDGVAFPADDLVFYQPHFFGFHDWLVGSPSNLNSQGGGYGDWLRIDNGTQTQETGWPELLRLDAIIDWWSQNEDTNKLCVWSMNLPHPPFTIPPAAAMPADYVPDNSSARGRYEAMIVSMDFMLGQILRFVDLNDTLVVWFGDNGTPPNAVGPEQDPAKVKRSTFEGGIRVPMRIMGTPIPQGVTYDGLSAITDLGPSLAKLMGVPTGGSDATPLMFEGLRNGLPYRDWILAERFVNRGDTPPPLSEEPDSELVIVEERYKYRLVDGADLVYDLLQDPEENAPIPPSHPGVAAFAKRARDIIDSLPPRYV